MPLLTRLEPAVALPGAEIELAGSDLAPAPNAALTAEVSGVPALVTLARPTRVRLRVPEGVLPGEVSVTREGVASNPLPLAVAVPLAENLNPVTSPVADAAGNLYTTLSGPRGQAMPVSIFRVAPAPAGVVAELRPYARDILNPSGLALSPAGELFVSSRAEGTVYRLDPNGRVFTFAEGLGIATGLAFDAAGDLYVGDRSGTLFKIRMERPAAVPGAAPSPQETFVFATLEPSIAFYHLAFSPDGTLYVTAPTTASSQSIYAIAPDGTASVYYRGLGRPQGLVVAPSGDLLVAATLAGERGIVRITPDGEASLAIAGANLVGLCLLPGNRAALATRDALYEVQL